MSPSFVDRYTSEQLTILMSYFNTFTALLRTIAIDSDNKDIKNIYDIVEIIAKYFKSEIYDTTFKPTPKGAILLDPESRKNLSEEAVGFALNAGAIIIQDSSKKIYRLSYLFSHEFRLLLTRQKPISLTDIFKKNKISNNQLNIIDPMNTGQTQMKLGFEYEDYKK